MANYTRREHVTTTVEYRVPAGGPWGATWSGVMTTLNAVLTEYREAMNVPSGAMISDDSIRVRLEDDDIVISFVKKEDDRA